MKVGSHSFSFILGAPKNEGTARNEWQKQKRALSILDLKKEQLWWHIYSWIVKIPTALTIPRMLERFRPVICLKNPEYIIPSWLENFWKF